MKYFSDISNSAAECFSKHISRPLIDAISLVSAHATARVYAEFLQSTDAFLEAGVVGFSGGNAMDSNASIEVAVAAISHKKTSKNAKVLRFIVVARIAYGPDRQPEVLCVVKASALKSVAL